MTFTLVLCDNVGLGSSGGRGIHLTVNTNCAECVHVFAEDNVVFKY